MRFSFRQWFLLVIFSTLIFTTSAIHTLLSSFLPVAVSSQGIGPVVNTVIFATFDVGAVLSSTLLIFNIHRLNFNRILCVSTFLQAFAVILFGALHEVKGYWMFFGSALVLRFCEGIGFAGTSVVVYSSIPLEFRTVRITVIYGVLNMWWVIGYSGGPYLGDVLYNVGGLYCPFLVPGVVLVTLGLFMPMIFYKLPIPSQPESLNNFMLWFRKPETLLNFLFLGLVTILLVLIDSIFPHWLRMQFFLDNASTQLSFWFIVLIQALAVILCGFVAGCWISLQVTIFSGGLLTVFGSFLMATLSLLQAKPNLVITLIGIAVLTVGISVLFLATLPCLLKEARRYGFPECRATAGLVSAAYVGTICTGGALGTTGARLMYDYDRPSLKYLPYALFVLSIFVFSCCVLYAGGAVFKKFVRKISICDSGIEDPEPEGQFLPEEHFASQTETSSLLKPT